MPAAHHTPRHHAGQRHGRLDDEVHFVRGCGRHSEERFAEERGGADAAHHSVISVDGGSCYGCQGDATKLTDIARNMNHVLAQQKAEKRLFLSEKAQEIVGSKSALEAICTLTG